MGDLLCVLVDVTDLSVLVVSEESLPEVEEVLCTNVFCDTVVVQSE